MVQFLYAEDTVPATVRTWDENSRAEKSGENLMFLSAAKELLNHLITAILRDSQW